MLIRTPLPNAIVYQSPLLNAMGVPHAFGTRTGDADAIARGLGLEKREWITVKQIHSNNVAHPNNDLSTRASDCEADAVVLDHARYATRIVTADCIPILLASLDGKKVAAIHAGWRGLIAGVIENAAQQLDAPFLAAVGPAISAAHFEVSPDVAKHFDPAHIHTPSPDAKPHIDLPAAAAARLQFLGAQAIDTTDRCTYRDQNDFYSHRRDVTHHAQPTTGRMPTLIACAS